LSIDECVCTFDDYTCDFGYEETFINGRLVCVLSTVNPPQDPPKNCVPGEAYEISTGYRIISGDSCFGALSQFSPTTKVCPPSANDKNSHVAVIVVLILLVLALVIGGFLVYRNEQWRAKVLSFVGVSSSGSSRYNRLGGRHGGLAEEEFGIVGDHDLDDSDVEEDAPVLQDNDIVRATADREKRGSGEHDFDPRT